MKIDIHMVDGVSRLKILLLSIDKGKWKSIGNYNSKNLYKRLQLDIKYFSASFFFSIILEHLWLDIKYFLRNSIS